MLGLPPLSEQGCGFNEVSMVVVVLPPRHLVESRCLKATDTHPTHETDKNKHEKESTWLSSLLIY